MMMYRLLAVSKRLRVPVVLRKPLYRLEIAPSLSFHSTRVLSSVLPTPQENSRDPSVLYAMCDHQRPAIFMMCAFILHRDNMGEHARPYRSRGLTWRAVVDDGSHLAVIQPSLDATIPSSRKYEGYIALDVRAH